MSTHLALPHAAAHAELRPAGAGEAAQQRGELGREHDVLGGERSENMLTNIAHNQLIADST